VTCITALEVIDVRFPTSRWLDGSDAMNPEPDYSAAYVSVRTTAGDAGHGFVFTIGRGTEVAVAAIRAVEALVVGREVEATLADLGGFWRRLVHDSQLRWLGPEKGVMHMAIGAVVNAVWDLAAKRAQKPLWHLLAGQQLHEGRLLRRRKRDLNRRSGWDPFLREKQMRISAMPWLPKFQRSFRAPHSKLWRVKLARVLPTARSSA